MTRETNTNENHKLEHTEYRLFGTAGAGKTTALKSMVENAASQFGSDSILLSSFSKTAAKELVSRNLPVAEERVATLHAHAYRALGRPEIAETKEWITDWNEYVEGRHEDFKLSGGQPTTDEPLMDFVFSTTGDKLLSEYNLLRARMVKLEDFLNYDLKVFVRLWEDFKKENDILDFTDLIATANRDLERAPFNPRVGFFDECQDFSKLELSLVRRWAKEMEYVVMAGDDEQAIFEFKGASPEAFLMPEIPETYKRILGRSWRVPRLIQEKSLKLIRNVKFRQEKNYEPRYASYYEDGVRKYDSSFIEDGHVEYSRYAFQNNLEPHFLVRDVSEKYLDNGQTVMFLASCSYQLVSLLKALREQGLAFHNPYRRTNGAWNPLGQRKTADKIHSYLSASNRIQDGLDYVVWTKKELLNWLDLVKTSQFLIRNAVKQISDSKLEEFRLTDIVSLFKVPEALQLAVDGNLDFLASNIKTSYEKRIGFLMSIINRDGIEKLFERPQIIVGTIHSVKGGEADTVVVCPDLSPQGYDAYCHHEKRDSVFRQFYVAETRAFQNLVIARPSGNTYIQL